jgi:hypothetical protein
MFAKLMHVLADGVDAGADVDEASEKVRCGQRDVLPGWLLDLESLPRVRVGTRVRRRPEVDGVMRVEADRVHLRFNGKVVTVPGFATNEVRRLLDVRDVSVEQLPGSVDDDGALMLIRCLVREGF